MDTQRNSEMNTDFEKILSEEERIISENWVTNIVAAFGCSGDSFFVSPSGDEINNRLWDLASVTKLYSLVSILSLHEKGLFDITKKVKDYSSNYPGIADLYVYELLDFSVELATSSRIDKCPSFDEAIDLLHGIQIKNRRTIYSDMGIIITAQLINEINPEVAIPTHYGSIVGKLSDAKVFAANVKDTIKVVEKIK